LLIGERRRQQPVDHLNVNVAGYGDGRSAARACVSKPASIWP